MEIKQKLGGGIKQRPKWKNKTICKCDYMAHSKGEWGVVRRMGWVISFLGQAGRTWLAKKAVQRVGHIETDKPSSTGRKLQSRPHSTRYKNQGLRT